MSGETNSMKAGDSSQNNEDTSAGGSQGPNHDDADLAQQESVVNINNRNVRLTLFCMVVFIIGVSGIRSGLWSLTYWGEDYLSSTIGAGGEPSAAQLEAQEEGETQGALTFVAYLVLWLASTVFLSGLYFSYCNCGAILDKVSAVLFFAGAGLLFGPMIKGMENSCENPLDSKAESNCNMNSVAGYIPLITVALFICIDIIKEVGSDIKIRLIVFSVMMAVRSLLLFLYNLYQLDVSEEAESLRLTDESDYNNYSSEASHFSYRWYISWYCIMLFLCAMIAVLAVMKCPLSNPSLPKIIGFVMLFAHGCDSIGFICSNHWICLPKIIGFAVSSSLLLSAVVMMMVYDIQYFF